MKSNKVSFGAVIFPQPDISRVTQFQKKLIRDAIIKDKKIKRQVDQLDKMGYDISVLTPSGSVKSKSLLYKLTNIVNPEEQNSPYIDCAPKGIKEVSNEINAAEFLQEAATKSLKFITLKLKKLAGD